MVVSYVINTSSSVISKGNNNIKDFYEYDCFYWWQRASFWIKFVDEFTNKHVSCLHRRRRSNTNKHSGTKVDELETLTTKHLSTNTNQVSDYQNVSNPDNPIET